MGMEQGGENEDGEGGGENGDWDGASDEERWGMKMKRWGGEWERG